MNKADYDRALYYTYHSQWDNLLVLMVRTKDHFLSKKIEKFLHAYYFEKDDGILKDHLLDLLYYVDHANSCAIAFQEDFLFSV